MNEEQKEQNIPAPVPPDNNDQDITPVNRWQIKSWHIIIVGVVVQILAAAVLMNALNKGSDSLGRGEGVLAGILFLIMLGVTVLFGTILGLLLYFEKSREWGAIISIISTPIFLVFIYIIIPMTMDTVPLVLLVFPAGVFFFLAGIYYFWKKV